MNADVGEACRGPRAIRICAPFRLFVSVGVDRKGEPVLDVSRVDDPDVADFASFNHFARLAHHRIAGVVEGHRKNEPFGAGELDQFRSLGERRRQRLVADDVNSRLEERLGDGEVQVVRGYDDDSLDAVRTGRLANGHFAIVRVGPVRRKPKLGARGARVFDVRRQSAGIELDHIVEPHGHAVNGADESVAPAADHADTQASALETIDGGRVDHRPSP